MGTGAVFPVSAKVDVGAREPFISLGAQNGVLRQQELASADFHCFVTNIQVHANWNWTGTEECGGIRRAGLSDREPSGERSSENSHPLYPTGANDLRAVLIYDWLLLSYCEEGL